MTTPTLHAYQREAVSFIQHRGRAGLFLDMGLGKTAIVLSALTPDHLPALVIAPKRVAEHTWDEEVRKWRPDLTVAKAIGRPDARRAALRSGADVVVCTRDNLGDLLTPDGKRTLKDLPAWRTVVIDELSGFKSMKSQRWRAARKISRHVPYRWGLTGTPTPNGLEDLWAQVGLLDDGERLGRTITGYRAAYLTAGHQLPNGAVVGREPLPGAPEKVFSLLEDLALSMSTEGRVDLPPVTQNVVRVDLPPKVLALQSKLKEESIVHLDVLGAVTAPSAGHLSNRYSQLSAGFLFADQLSPDAGSYEWLHDEKIRAAQEIVEETGSPVLMFYRYRPELARLRKAFGPTAHTMDEPDIVARWNAGEIPLLLAHPASAGHGLNLQHGGHTIVWTSLPWSMEEWAQANKRVARQGQRHPVIIHVIAAERSIDHRILDALAGKISFQQALMDHLESPL